MFKKHLISLAVVWIGLILACFLFLRHDSSNAQIQYKHLMNFSDQAKKEYLKDHSSLTQQTRHHVSKQIFYKKDLYRLQSRLASERSNLLFDSKVKGSEFVEHFHGLVGAMQENLIEPSKKEETVDFALQDHSQAKQAIRYFKAQEAVYSYKTGQLHANDVLIAHYLIPGLVLPHSLESFSPLLQGQAQKIQLTLFKETLLKAQDFQMTFYDWGG